MQNNQHNLTLPPRPLISMIPGMQVKMAPQVNQRIPVIRLTITTLMAAVKRGDFQSIHNSINTFGFPPNGSKTTDYVILQTAIQRKHINIAKFLVEKGCSVNNSNINNQFLSSPLYLAVELNDRDLVFLLLQKGAKIDFIDPKSGMTPLHLAAKFFKKSFRILNLLLDYNPNINIRDRNNTTVLYILLNENLHITMDKNYETIFLRIISKMIAKNVSVTDRCNDQTPLHVAAKMRLKSVLPLLVEVGGNVNEVTSYGTILHCLLSNDMNTSDQLTLENVKMLLAKGASILLKDKHGRTPLHLSAIHHHYNVLNYFLNYKIDLEVLDSSGKTTFYYLMNNLQSSLTGRTEQHWISVKNMVARGVRVNVIDKNITELLVFSHNQRIIYELLCGVGATDYQDNDGNSFLHILLLFDQVNMDVVKKMVFNLKFRVDLPNKHGKTALLLAAEKKNLELLEIFLQTSKIDLNAYNLDGNTILHFLLEGLHSGKFLDIFKTLLANGASVDIINKKGYSPMHIAALKKRNDLILILLQYSKYCAFDSRNNSLLYLVLENFLTVPEFENNSIETVCEIVKILLVKGALIDSKNQNGEMPVHLMVKINKKILTNIFVQTVTKANLKSDGKSLDHFLDYFLNFKTLPDIIRIQRGSSENQSLQVLEPQIVATVEMFFHHGFKVESGMGHYNLVKAIEFNLKLLVNCLLNHMSNFNTLDDSGNNMLHDYVRNKHDDMKMTKMFIEKGVSVNAVNLFSETPLTIAVKNLDLETTKILVEFSADINFITSEGCNIIHVLLSQNKENPQLLEFLIQKGANIEFKNKSGFSPLHIACKNNFLDTCKILIKYGADVKTVDNDGYSVLHFLSKHTSNVDNLNRKIELIELLINYGQDINVVAKNGMTPLHMATIAGNINLIDFLIKKGAQVDCKNLDNGASPIHLAAENDRDDVIEILLKDNVQNLNLRQKDHRTALHIATRHQTCKALTKLIQLGADLDLYDFKGKTALHWACWYENVKGVTELLSFGADINFIDGNDQLPLNYSVSRNNHIYPIIYKQVLMLQEAEFFVSSTLIKKLKENNVDDVSEYFKSNCREEIAKMKKIFLDSVIRLYDLFLIDLNKLSNYRNNVNLHKILESDISTEYPVYSSWIKANYLKGVIRNILSEKAEKSLWKLTRFNLPVSCSRNIFKFLDNETLSNLINVIDIKGKKRKISFSEASNLPVKKSHLNYK